MTSKWIEADDLKWRRTPAIVSDVERLQEGRGLDKRRGFGAISKRRVRTRHAGIEFTPGDIEDFERYSASIRAAGDTHQNTQ